MTKTPFSGIPVIAVAGWGFGTEVVQPLAAAFPPGMRFDAVAPADLQRAASDAAPAGKGQGLAQSLSGRIAATGRPALLVGWSLGALVALETALLSPQSVSALILISATARFCRAPGYRAGVPAPLVEAMIARLAVDPATVLADFFRQVFLPETAPGGALEHLVGRASRFDPGALSDGLRHLLRTDLRERLSAVACPTLILHGDQDRVIPVAAAVQLHRGLPASRLEIVPGAGHAVALSRRTEIEERVGSFLRELRHS